MNQTISIIKAQINAKYNNVEEIVGLIAPDIFAWINEGRRLQNGDEE